MINLERLRDEVGQRFISLARPAYLIFSESKTGRKIAAHLA